MIGISIIAAPNYALTKSMILIFFVIVYPMPHSQPLLQQGFATFAVYTDSLGVGREWRLPEDPAHVVEEPSDTEEGAGIMELVKAV